MPTSAVRTPWLLGFSLAAIACSTAPAPSPTDAAIALADASGRTNRVAADSSPAIADSAADAIMDDAASPLDVQPASSTLQRKPFVAVKAADLAVNPLFGIATSRRHILLSLAATATNADVASLVAASTGQMAGAVPKAGLLQLELPPATTPAVCNDRVAVLAGMPGVRAVAVDVPMYPQVLPAPIEPPEGAPKDWDWTWQMPADANWGLEYVRAPLAWNLNDHIDDVGDATPVVAVIDSGFAAHPDLPDADDPEEASSHGTQVAGVIGATWGDGEYVDGLAPRVELQLYALTPKPATVDEWVPTFASSIEAVASTLDGVDPRPRVVNLSNGYNWSVNCHTVGAKTGRCDPHLGATIADQICDGYQAGHVRKLIADHGRMFGVLVQAANDADEMLFVLAAGNDAGVPPAPTTPPLCDVIDKLPRPPHGLAADFPQDLSSPGLWAASHDSLASAHIVVAEALSPPKLAGYVGATRAPFSNAKVEYGAHAVYAPGVDIGVLKPGKEPSVALSSGTSFSAPLVSGAAAFLLSVEPALTDAMLIQLLTLPPYANSMPGGGSLTEASLNLYGALLGIDTVMPGRPVTVRQWLTDCDDGTQDGFTRADVKTGDPMLLDGVGDGVVDLRDFRRLRDSIWMGMGTLLPPATPALYPKWDLNKDGVVVTPGEEFFARTLWTEYDGMLPSATQADWFGGANVTHIAIFQSQYSVDELQPWPVGALVPLLTNSADLHIDAKAAIAKKGGSHADIEIVDQAGGLLPAWAPYAVALKDLTVGPEGAVLTVPIFAAPGAKGGVRLRWRVLATDPFDELDISPPLGLGEDRLVELGACPKPVAALAPGSAYSTAYCLPDPQTGGCLGNCGKCPDGKITLDASASQLPDGSKAGLTYKWQVATTAGLTCVLNKLGPAPEAKNPMYCVFKGSPTCSGMVSESATVTVTVSNGCSTSSAVRKMPVNCVGK